MRVVFADSLPIPATRPSIIVFLSGLSEIIGVSEKSEINAPASRLKKSCRGVKSNFRYWSSHPVSVFGACRWKRSGLCGGGLNSKAAWVRSGCQIWHPPSNTTIIMSGLLFGRRLHGILPGQFILEGARGGLKSCKLATLPQCISAFLKFAP